MTTLAILPIKNLDQAKQRLRAELDPTPRRALVEAMFSDTLVALRRATALPDVLVVSADNRAQRIAEGYGATVLDDADAGHSDAALLGLRRAVELGADRVLLLPADCPLLDPGRARRAGAGRPRTAPCSSSPTATAPAPTRWCSPRRTRWRPSFGQGSHARHLGTRAPPGSTPRPCELPSLALDLDTPEDLAAVEADAASTRGGAAHTRGMLRQLLRSRG